MTIMWLLDMVLGNIITDHNKKCLCIAGRESTWAQQPAILQVQACSHIDQLQPTKEVCGTRHVLLHRPYRLAHRGMMYPDGTGAFPVCSFHNMHYVFMVYIYDLHTGMMYTDGTGAFPVCSFHNMHSVFMVYIYDLSDILVCTMPSKNSSNNDGAMIAAFMENFMALNSRGYAPRINIMDNE